MPRDYGYIIASYKSKHVDDILIAIETNHRKKIFSNVHLINFINERFWIKRHVWIEMKLEGSVSVAIDLRFLQKWQSY